MKEELRSRSSNTHVATGTTQGTRGSQAPEGTRDAGSALSSSILEQEGYNRKQLCQGEGDGGFIKGIAVRCNSWMCKQCKRRKGYAFRSRLLGKAELFCEPRLYTITIGREWHSSPEEAYQHVSENGYIRRLMSLLGVKRWLWVLEAQEGSGNGWPHWHLLIDVSELPGQWYHRDLKVASREKPKVSEGWVYIPHFFDLNRVHRLLRRWGIGEQCYLSGRKEDFASAEHAINYITKYLVKMPKRGFPPWMLNRPRIRFMGASKEVGRLVATEREKPGEETQEEAEEREGARRPVERVAECGEKLVFVRFSEEAGGYEIIAQVNAPKKALELCPGALEVEDLDFETLQTFKVWGFGSLADVWRFADVWEDKALREGWKERREHRIAELLEQWGRREAVQKRTHVCQDSG